jgi:hypothetical protein
MVFNFMTGIIALITYSKLFSYGKGVGDEAFISVI